MYHWSMKASWALLNGKETGENFMQMSGESLVSVVGSQNVIKYQGSGRLAIMSGTAWRVERNGYY